MTPDTSVGSLSLREWAGVREIGEFHRSESSNVNPYRPGLSGRWITPDASVGSLSLRERAGVREIGEFHPPESSNVNP
jgi:hypothetical protein